MFNKLISVFKTARTYLNVACQMARTAVYLVNGFIRVLEGAAAAAVA